MTGMFQEKPGGTCLSFLNDKILKCFDDGLLTGMILTDLHKGFNMIDKQILLRELSILGFSDGTVKIGFNVIYHFENFL